MDNRLKDPIGIVNVVLDGTDCPIQRPLNNEIQRQFYSGKHKKHTIKYEVGVQSISGNIVWISGGLPGSIHDLTMARIGNIQSYLFPFEYVLADKAYIGEEQFITPIRSPQTEEEELYNRIISTHRITVEHTIGRLKNFNCLSHKWRHNILLHPIIFNLLCNVVNVDILFSPFQ